MLRASEVVLRRSSQILLNAARCQATASIPAPEEVRANQPIYTKVFFFTLNYHLPYVFFKICVLFTVLYGGKTSLFFFRIHFLAIDAILNF
uniref:Uncharacterized protein n=1 Tax=Ascaris lumbricoides TaxID=6252 RepID=A0A0M3IP94_ASCLU